MSRLESRTKPIIERLLDQPRIALAKNDQEVLATWMAKNAMVFEALRGQGPWFYTREERVALKDLLQIPARTNVWIAKCVDIPGAYCEASNHYETATRDSSGAHLYVTTMAFGCIALQTATLRLPPSIPISTRVTTDLRAGPWEQCALGLWPGTRDSWTWPPDIGLAGEAGIKEFHSRWRVDR
jgi:hypothetical protein